MSGPYEAKVAQCEQKILNYTFNDKLLCLQALQMSSNPVVWNNLFQPVPKNDRLAILGESILKAHFCRVWFESRMSKAEWTETQLNVLSNKELAQVGSKVELGACVIAQPGSVSGVTDKMISTTMQALIGAVSIDGGTDAMVKVLGILNLGRVDADATAVGHEGKKIDA